jgi:hypothetical protein
MLLSSRPKVQGDSDFDALPLERVIVLSSRLEVQEESESSSAKRLILLPQQRKLQSDGDGF